MLDTISMAEKLTGEYNVVFTKADMYSVLEGNNDEQTIDDKMMNLYDLLLQAQADGIPANKIVGSDVEKFCRTYFKAEKKSKWRSIADGFYYLSWWGLIMGLLEFSLQEPGNVKFYQMNIDIAYLLTGVALGVLFLLLTFPLKKTILKSKKIKPTVMYTLVLLFFIIGGGVSIVLTSMFDIKVMVKLKTLLLFSGFYIVGYLLVRAIYRYKDHGSIRKYSKEETLRYKEEKEEKEAFNKEVSKRSMKSLAKDMNVRYRRLNRRHQKKYHTPLPLEDFATKLRKEREQVPKNIFLWIVVDAVLVLLPVICCMANGSLGEGLFVLIVMCVVMFFIYRFQIWMDKITLQTIDEQLDVIKMCLEQGMDLESVGEMEVTS